MEFILAGGSFPQTGRFQFYCWRLCGIFSEGFESRCDRVTTHVRLSPLLLLGEFPFKEPDPIRTSQRCWGWLGEGVRRGCIPSTQFLKPTCRFQEKSGTLKAQFQNCLLIPLKETYCLTNHGPAFRRDTSFSQILGSLICQMSFCTSVILNILWLCGQPDF